jgi:hypothetical protein
VAVRTLSLAAASTVALTASMTRASALSGGREKENACVSRADNIWETHVGAGSPASGEVEAENVAFAEPFIGVDSPGLPTLPLLLLRLRLLVLLAFALVLAFAADAVTLRDGAAEEDRVEHSVEIGGATWPFPPAFVAELDGDVE